MDMRSHLVFGTLYPAYYSFKAVKSKNVKEYVRWMMYWIVFALYTVVETITDLSLAWFPVYYELKMAFVFWLLSPYTRGASVLYRKFLHPMLASKEREIDEYIVQARGEEFMRLVNLGSQGLTMRCAAVLRCCEVLHDTWFFSGVVSSYTHALFKILLGI
ncbi:hypothetical protein QQF64_022079 [Cirrhinus molitorella]|uniref:Receptor expression-enhancing protein n=1 Tax=Cirrhinus molitorella TaxID=172907 RepID=A0ABR3L9G5_9TELE